MIQPLLVDRYRSLWVNPDWPWRLERAVWWKPEQGLWTPERGYCVPEWPHRPRAVWWQP